MRLCRFYAIIQLKAGDFMKKFKEFLLLFVPFIVLTILPIIIFVINQNENAFVSNEHYLRLLLNDSIFWNAIFNTYYKAIIFSALAVVCVALLCHFIKYIKSRKVFYPVSVVCASVVAFLSTYFNRVNYFGLPMGIYDPQYLVSDTAPKISISIYDIILAMQIGFLTTFLFWLGELLVLLIKKKKSK